MTIDVGLAQITGYETTKNKNQPNGYAGLTASKALQLGIYAGLSVYQDNLGSSVFFSNDIETSEANATDYTKLKTINLIATPDSSLSLYWEWHTENGTGPAHTRIYRNGSAQGNDHFLANLPLAYTAATETVSGWVDGDTLELWGYMSPVNHNHLYVRNFRILATLAPLLTYSNP
jgi:hypothetical protein